MSQTLVSNKNSLSKTVILINVFGQKNKKMGVKMNNFNLGNDGIEVAVWDESPFAKKVEFIKNGILPRYTENLEKKVFVKSNFKSFPDGGGKLAFSEQNEAHPDGLAFVAGESPTQIALTAAAVEALNKGLIMVCKDDDVRAFVSAKLAETRAAIERQKETYRKKYISLTGNDSNFESAWTQIRARLGLEIIVEGN